MNAPQTLSFSDTSDSPAAHAFPAALPWHWFDFDQPSRPLPTDGAAAIPSINPHGAQPAWHITIDGRRVPFKFFRRQSASHPSRPVLLMLHGMGLTIATFRGVAGYLLPSHDLLLPDYSSLMTAGPADPANSGAKLYAQTVWRLADALQINHASLAGNSLGGGVALLAAIMQPARVEKLLLSNPACFPQKLPQMYRMARIPLIGELLMLISSGEKLVGGVEYVGFVDKSRFDPELRSRYIHTLSKLENRFRLMDMMRRLPADERDLTAAPHLAQLDHITQPVLLTWGQQDPLLSTGAGERLARALPNVTFDAYPDLSHMPHEEDPERVGRRWASWLSQNSNDERQIKFT